MEIFPEGRRGLLVHLAGFGFEVFFERDFEVEELFAVGVFDGVQIEKRTLQGMREAADVIEEEAGASCVRLDDEGGELEGIKVGFYGFVAGLGLAMDGDGPGDGDLGALFFLEGHEAFNVFGVGGLDAVALLGDEEDASVTEADGLVAVVGDDEADGHDAVCEVVDAEELSFFFGFVGLDGDGELFIGVDFDGGEVGGGLDGGRRVVYRAENRAGEGGCKQRKQGKTAKAAKGHGIGSSVMMAVAATGLRQKVRAGGCLLNALAFRPWSGSFRHA